MIAVAAFSGTRAEQELSLSASSPAAGEEEGAPVIDYPNAKYYSTDEDPVLR